MTEHGDEYALVIDSLATYRLVRLVVRDTITRPARARLIAATYGHDTPLTDREWEDRVHGDDDAPKLATLITCAWCSGVWLSFGVLAARRLFPRWWDPVARALAVSAVAALTTRLEEDI